MQALSCPDTVEKAAFGGSQETRPLKQERGAEGAAFVRLA